MILCKLPSSCKRKVKYAIIYFYKLAKVTYEEKKPNLPLCVSVSMLSVQSNPLGCFFFENK